MEEGKHEIQPVKAVQPPVVVDPEPLEEVEAESVDVDKILEEEIGSDSTHTRLAPLNGVKIMLKGTFKKFERAHSRNTQRLFEQYSKEVSKHTTKQFDKLNAKFTNLFGYIVHKSLNVLETRQYNSQLRLSAIESDLSERLHRLDNPDNLDLKAFREKYGEILVDLQTGFNDKAQTKAKEVQEKKKAEEQDGEGSEPGTDSDSGKPDRDADRTQDQTVSGETKQQPAE